MFNATNKFAGKRNMLGFAALYPTYIVVGEILDKKNQDIE